MSKLSERRKQIREYNLGEAEQELERLRRQLFELRIQHQRGEVKNNRQFTQVRTDIARLMYQIDVLNQAALEEELAEQEAAMAEEAEAATGEAEEGEAEEAEAEEAEAEEASAAEAEEKPASKAAQTDETTGTSRRGRKTKAKEEA